MGRGGDLDLLRRLEPSQAWLSTFTTAGGRVLRVGPFLALMDGDGGAALPTEPLGDEQRIKRSVDRLHHVFSTDSQPLKIEYNERLYPALAPILLESGLTVEAREPLMVCLPSEFVPRMNADVQVRFLTSRDGDPILRAYQTIFAQVLLERTDDVGDEAVASLRTQIERQHGRSHALASIDDTPVGTGFVSSSSGVCEITRVAVLPQFRRRGIASTLTSFMLYDRFQLQGDTLAWLTAASSAARALYHALGFRDLGERMYFAQAEAHRV